MNPNFSENISSVLGRKNPTKGVKVEVDEKNVSIDFYITVEYRHESLMYHGKYKRR